MMGNVFLWAEGGYRFYRFLTSQGQNVVQTGAEGRQDGHCDAVQERPMQRGAQVRPRK